VPISYSTLPNLNVQCHIIFKRIERNNTRIDLISSTYNLQTYSGTLHLTFDSTLFVPDPNIGFEVVAYLSLRSDPRWSNRLASTVQNISVIRHDITLGQGSTISSGVPPSSTGVQTTSGMDTNTLPSSVVVVDTGLATFMVDETTSVLLQFVADFEAIDIMEWNLSLYSWLRMEHGITSSNVRSIEFYPGSVIIIITLFTPRDARFLREQYIDNVDIQLYVNDIAYAGAIFEHSEYMFSRPTRVVVTPSDIPQNGMDSNEDTSENNSSIFIAAVIIICGCVALTMLTLCYAHRKRCFKNRYVKDIEHGVDIAVETTHAHHSKRRHLSSLPQKTLSKSPHQIIKQDQLSTLNELEDDPYGYHLTRMSSSARTASVSELSQDEGTFQLNAYLMQRLGRMYAKEQPQKKFSDGVVSDSLVDLIHTVEATHNPDMLEEDYRQILEQAQFFDGVTA